MASEEFPIFEPKVPEAGASAPGTEAKKPQNGRRLLAGGSLSGSVTVRFTHEGRIEEATFTGEEFQKHFTRPKPSED
jgi:hypothetical protein